jgi:hypothetical protein
MDEWLGRTGYLFKDVAYRCGANAAAFKSRLRRVQEEQKTLGRKGEIGLDSLKLNEKALRGTQSAFGELPGANFLLK